MGFKKYEVLVRKNSEMPLDDVIKTFKKAINEKQDNDPKQYWAAHVFDLRSLKEFMIFSDKSKEVFQIEGSNYDTQDNKKIDAVMDLGEKILNVDKKLNESFDENLNKKLPDIKNNFLNDFNNQFPELTKKLKIDNIPNFKDTLNSIHEKISNMEKDIISKVLNMDKNNISDELINELNTLNDLDENTISKLINDLENSKGYTL